MIGYVLLVTFAIIMGSVIYQWVKTYVPKDIMDCPDETSILIKDVSFDCESLELNITLQNNGRFNIAGYFIHATSNPNQTLATIDLSSDIVDGGKLLGNSILFSPVNENSFIPNNEPVTHFFNLNQKIYSIEITPIRYQLEENRERLVSCGNSKVRETVVCG